MSSNDLIAVVNIARMENRFNIGLELINDMVEKVHGLLQLPTAHLWRYSENQLKTSAWISAIKRINKMSRRLLDDEAEQMRKDVWNIFQIYRFHSEASSDSAGVFVY